jgi:hypothetical protein
VKQYFSAISMLVLLMTLSSCLDLKREDPVVLQQIINDGVEIRVSEFKEREWIECIAQAEQLAVAKADSIIRARARYEAVEPIIKPPKPDRPVKPPTKVLTDTVHTDTIKKQ